MSEQETKRKQVDWEKPIRCRWSIGRAHAARLLGVLQGRFYPYVVAVQSSDDEEFVYYANETGETALDGIFENVPEKRVAWINIYEGDMGVPRWTKEEADRVAQYHGPRIACVKVEYEVGQFDE